MAEPAPKPELRMRHTEAGLYVRAEDVLAWLRYLATRCPEAPAPPPEVIEQTANAWRDVWLGATRSAVLDDGDDGSTRH